MERIKSRGEKQEADLRIRVPNEMTWRPQIIC